MKYKYNYLTKRIAILNPDKVFSKYLGITCIFPIKSAKRIRPDIARHIENIISPG